MSQPVVPVSLADPFAGRPANLADAEARIVAIRALLGTAGLTHRNPPPVPTTCCGRGCNGCVWEGYYGALRGWCDDARALLDGALPQVAG